LPFTPPIGTGCDPDHFMLQRSNRSASMPNLFEAAKLGALTLRNRIIMAPLTRSRTGHAGIPGPLNATYYAQRATAGAIIAEATQISPQGQGYAFTPGIHSAEQVAGWRQVTEAVHREGGRIILQLWHVGRISHPSLQPGGGLPVAPSAIQPEGQAFTESGFQLFVTPRALETNEIASIVEDYRQAAVNADKAGFDGVEIHGANGYLIDQFLKDGTNHRTDQYGGSIENRTRFLLKVTEAVVGVLGGDRVGLRLSPASPANDISDSNPQPLFDHAVAALARFNLAFLHVVEGATGGSRETDFDFQALRQAFKGAYVANNGYDRALAEEAIAAGRTDFIAFGRPFIANPDLVDRLRIGAPLAELDRDTLYGGDAKGYTDYPALTRAAA
jgi:N-ethylmaleimide reductase